MTQRIPPYCSVLALVLSGLIAACGGGKSAGTTSSTESADTDSHRQLAKGIGASSNIVVKASADLAGNVGAQMNVRVNGTLIGSIEVRATTPQDYSFIAPSVPVGSLIDVAFINDGMVNKEDRNLYVQSVTANGTTIAANSPGVRLDRGAGEAAYDGMDVMPGQIGLMWNGALRFQFGAAATASVSDGTLLTRDAFRLADQATFGATEALISTIQLQGTAAWLKNQTTTPQTSHYTLGGDDAIHKNTSTTHFCNLPAQNPATCWTNQASSIPLVWDFYRNATQKDDQLRQRMALALQQILVVSGLEIAGTYGMRAFNNSILDNALGNYRDILRKVALSPVMGDFLNNANNDKAAPNENFGRELLQLFSVGTCNLNGDGTLAGGVCTQTYTNDTVRNYAYALTGWTYPAGGLAPFPCLPAGVNCRYYNGDMTPVSSLHDTASRTLLSNVIVPAGSTAPQALEAVLDSLMNHPNTAPFIGRQLINFFVTSNPSPAYVLRVANVFNTGRFTFGQYSFGAAKRGDLTATIAAILLDSEARNSVVPRSSGKLREPVLMLAGVLRALNGSSDGDVMTWWFGDMLNQHLFRAPSVFDFYSPTNPVPGTTLVGPAFGIHNGSTAAQRLNYLSFLLYTGGIGASPGVQGGFGTAVDIQPFVADASDENKLVDRLSILATGAPLPADTRADIVTAVLAFNSQNNATWQVERVRQAAYLIFGSPQYQIQH